MRQKVRSPRLNTLRGCSILKAGGDEDTVLHRELEGVREQEERPPAQHEVWESETGTANGQLTLPLSGARDNQHVESVGEQIPGEFFYFNWP